MICADTLEEHDSIIEKLLQRGRDYNVKFNFNNMQYCVQEGTFFGVIFN